MIDSIQAAVALQFQVAAGTPPNALPAEPGARPTQTVETAPAVPQRSGQASLANAASLAYVQNYRQNVAGDPLPPSAGKDSAGYGRERGASDGKPALLNSRGLGAYAARTRDDGPPAAAGLDSFA